MFAIVYKSTHIDIYDLIKFSLGWQGHKENYKNRENNKNITKKLFEIELDINVV